RPITYEPDLPQRLLDGTAEKSLVTPKTLGHKNIDDLLNSAWHQQQIARMGRGRAVRPRRGPAIALAIALLSTGRDLLVPWLAPSWPQISTDPALRPTARTAEPTPKDNI